MFAGIGSANEWIVSCWMNRENTPVGLVSPIDPIRPRSRTGACSRAGFGRTLAPNHGHQIIDRRVGGSTIREKEEKWRCERRSFNLSRDGIIDYQAEVDENSSIQHWTESVRGYCMNTAPARYPGTISSDCGDSKYIPVSLNDGCIFLQLSPFPMLYPFSARNSSNARSSFGKSIWLLSGSRQ